MNNLTAVTPQTRFIDVVGVVRELKLQSLTQDEQVPGACYFPVAQNLPPPQAPAIAFNYAIRTPGDPAAIGGAVGTTIRRLDRELAVFDTLTMAERVDRSLRIRRSPMLLAISFGVIGLFLSAVGIYGVLVYVVAQRTRELGVRMALGCGRRQIFDLVLREGLMLVAVGFGVGLLGALALRQSLQSQLFGIAAADPFVLALVAAILAVVAVAASTLPAHRATRIDPIIALTE